MPAVREPQKKRGAAAWARVRTDGLSHADEMWVNRLLVHSVEDGAGLLVYYPEVRKVLVLLLEMNCRVVDLDELY